MHKESHYIKQCQVGDRYYRIIKDTIIPIQITKINRYELGHYVYEDDSKNHHLGQAFGKSLFKTKEECEEELRKRKCIKDKRKLLKEYEEKLNEELNIKGHYIIK